MIIWTIAKTTIGDAMRKKILQVFLVVGIALIIMSLPFSGILSFSGREGAAVDLMFIKSFGLGLMALAGALISVVMGVSLIPQEIERKTIYTILSKPVKRYEFIVGKFLGAVLTLGINILMMGLVFIIAVTLKAKGASLAAASAASGVTDAGALAINIFDWNMVYGVILIFLQFMILMSVIMLFSTFLTPTVNFFAGTGFYILGVMGSMVKSIAESQSLNAVLKWIYTIVMYVVPNFDKFNVTNKLLHPDITIASVPKHTLGLTVLALIYFLATALIAVLIFEKKEV